MFIELNIGISIKEMAWESVMWLCILLLSTKVFTN